MCPQIPQYQVDYDKKKKNYDIQGNTMSHITVTQRVIIRSINLRTVSTD